MTKFRRFKNLTSMKIAVVEKLNAMFTKNPPIVLNKSDTYIYLKCMFAKCEFSAWYKYKVKEEDKIYDIEWFRTINCNHSAIAHQLSSYRDQTKSKFL